MVNHAVMDIVQIFWVTILANYLFYHVHTRTSRHTAKKLVKHANPSYHTEQ